MSRTARVLMVVAFAVLGTAGPAAAGSYDVAMCGAPGGGGVNNSWEPTKGSFDGSDATAWYQHDTTCANGLGVQSTGTSPWAESDRAGFLSAGSWVFRAPAGTRVTRVTMWRYGEASDDRAETAENGWANYWTLSAQDDTGNQIAGGYGNETCGHGQGSDRCSVGNAGGVVEAARSQHDVNTTTLSWGVVCGAANGTLPAGGCAPNYGGYPLAYWNLYGALVTVTDDVAPVVAAEGPLLGGGVRPGTGTADYTATDAAGVASVRLLVDDKEVDRDDLTCDYTKAAPCPVSPKGSLTLGAAREEIADGPHRLSLIAEDAAGNTTRSDQDVVLDTHGPAIGAARVVGRSVSVPVRDTQSGVVSGAIEFRPSAGAPWQPLPTTIASGRLTAQGPGSLRGKGLRVTATDGAGLTTAGQALRVELKAKVGRARARTVRGGKVAVGFGKATSLTGRLVTLDAQPVAGAAITMTQRVRGLGATEEALPALTTDAGGRFAYRAPKGYSRDLKLEIGGSGDVLPRTVGVRLGVRATSSITASRRTLSGAGTVTFSGRLKLGGASVPQGGKVVAVQGRGRGAKWISFGQVRARGAAARWRKSYRFNGTPGLYRVRLRVTREAVFPYEVGYSRTITVRVR